MRELRFSSTRLSHTGKKGILTPDANGYYEMPVGGLNAFNSAGEYYTYEGAEKLFRSSSILMRRVDKGVLKSELGHPKPLPGMSDDDYLERVLSIEETNVVAHIKELRLDMNFGRNNPKFRNPDLVAVIAKFKPSGPHGAALEASLQNPDENVTFSIRGLTENYAERGQTFRVLRTIVTFDQVTEQGINIANKWDAPALESVSNVLVLDRQLERIAEGRTPIALESTKEIAREALKASQSIGTLPSLPLYANWK